jgi:hypothetical protein
MGNVPAPHGPSATVNFRVADRVAGSIAWQTAWQRLTTAQATFFRHAEQLRCFYSGVRKPPSGSRLSRSAEGVIPANSRKSCVKCA